MIQRSHIKHSIICLMLVMLYSAFLFQNPAKAAQATASLTTNREEGTITYTVNGLTESIGSSMTIRATGKTTTDVWEQSIDLTEENCKDGVYTGTISLQDVTYAFDIYTVTAVIGTDTISVGTADLSIHTANAALKIAGKTGAAVRTATLTSTDTTGDVLVPGTGNKVAIHVWSKPRAATTAVEAGISTPLTNSASTTWSIDISKAGLDYGTWCAKAVVTNSAWSDSYTLATAEYKVLPSCTKFKTKKSTALEKKKSFAIELTGLQNVYGIEGVNFLIKNSQGKQIATIKGKKKANDNSQFYNTITMKQLKYNMDKFTITAVVVDINGKASTMTVKTTVDQRIKKGTLSITKKKDASCNYKMTGVYIPGNIKKIEYIIYEVKSGKKKKLGVYKATASSDKKKYVANIKNENKGSFLVKAYGYTTWGSRFFLTKKNLKIKKKDMGKNGWFYEKYNGKKYKFYYLNNEKLTDLTDILKLKKSSATNKNKFYIEVNRAASAVTVYMYNDETNKYDIPVKTFSVCVGRDISTNAGTGGLNENSSYTPLGTYSVCTNGESVKYTLKPMHEPDGSIVYARWATHIVGNVYFHSIAVGTQSHYALPSYRYNLLGSPASAGCIRMAVADAKWIYDYTSTGNTVKIVKGNSKKPGPLGKAPTIKVKNINYDPTDPAVPDSRKKKDYKAGRITGYMTKKGVKVGY